MDELAEGDIVECPVCHSENPLEDIKPVINKQQLLGWYSSLILMHIVATGITYIADKQPALKIYVEASA